MIGGSYGGQIQFATAAIDSRVDTLVPLITWNDLRYSLAPNNTSFTSGVTYAGSNPGHREDRVGRAVLRRRHPRRAAGRRHRPDPQRRLPQLRPRGLPGQGHPRHARLPDGLDDQADRPGVGGHYIDKVKVPTFLIQGENDTLFNLQEATATYRSLKARGVPVTMAWQSWGHSGGTGANTGAAPGELDLTGRAHRGHLPRPAHQELVRPLPQGLGGLDRPRLLLLPRLGRLHRQRRAGLRQRRQLSGGSRKALVPVVGGPARVVARSAILPGSTSWSNPGLGAPASYTEISGLEGQVDLPDGLTIAVRHPRHLRRLVHPRTDRSRSPSWARPPWTSGSSRRPWR